MVSVRILTPNDAAAFHQVKLSILRSDQSAFVTQADEFETRPLTETSERLKPNENVVTFGAFRDKELLGIITLVRNTESIFNHRVNIFGMGVLASARGLGIGDALMKAIITHTEQWSGVTSLFLSVFESQVAAKYLHEKHGFEVWGIKPDAVHRNGQVFKEYWMWRAIGQETAQLTQERQ